MTRKLDKLELNSGRKGRKNIQLRWQYLNTLLKCQNHKKQNIITAIEK